MTVNGAKPGACCFLDSASEPFRYLSGVRTRLVPSKVHLHVLDVESKPLALADRSPEAVGIGVHEALTPPAAANTSGCPECRIQNLNPMADAQPSSSAGLPMGDPEVSGHQYFFHADKALRYPADSLRPCVSRGRVQPPGPGTNFLKMAASVEGHLPGKSSNCNKKVRRLAMHTL